jgi:hypothetical protein
MNWKINGSEMRESPRFESNFIVCIEGKKRAFKSQGNIGIGGFCFEGPATVRPGTRVELCFELLGANRFVVATGVVLGLRVHQGRIDIRGRFTEIEFEDERILARWLDHQATFEQSRLVA